MKCIVSCHIGARPILNPAFIASLGQLCLFHTEQPNCTSRASIYKPIDTRKSPQIVNTHPINASTRSPPPAAIDEQTFALMCDQLQTWRSRYYTSFVPRATHDSKELGEWCHKLRRAKSKGQLPLDTIAILDALDFVWKPDTITAKWHDNFHKAREYKEIHGPDSELPPDYTNPERADWVEAARWLERQKDLYRQQKLSQPRVRMLKEVLSMKLSRESGPTRRNMHPELQRQNEEFKALLDDISTIRENRQ